RNQVDSLGALQIGLDIDADLLPLIESAHARLFDSADMDKDVLAAIFRRDKAETLVHFEKLHGSRDHLQCLYVQVRCQHNAISGEENDQIGKSAAGACTKSRRRMSQDVGSVSEALQVLTASVASC